MLKTIENKIDQIFIPRGEPHSTSAKSSNENTPNIPKKSLPVGNKISIEGIASKNGLNQFGKFSSINKNINNKSGKDNLIIIDANISHNPNDQKNGQKEYLEKKRRRRKRCSYSNCRNKRSKRRANIPQLYHEKNNPVINKDLICQSASTKNPSLIELKEEISEDEERMTEKIYKISNENTKKKSKVNEKELILFKEKVFMDNLNKNYSDEQYSKDLDMNLKEKKVQFMKENFPIMFRKDKYYLYSVLLKKRRTQPIHFIQPNTLTADIQESRKHQTLYLKEELDYSDNLSLKNSNKEIIHITENIKDQSQNKLGNNQNQKNKSKPFHLYDSEIISSAEQRTNDNNNYKEEVDQIKEDLINPKKPIQEKFKKNGPGLSDTSPSDHDGKNIDIIHLKEDIEGQNDIDKNNIKFKKTYNLLPTHIWSPPKVKNFPDVELFYDDCIQIWPFNQCTFIKEIALEFLMKNNYSSELCFKRIKDFVFFMKKRAEELNISVINKNEKTVKKYSLRNTKKIS